MRTMNESEAVADEERRLRAVRARIDSAQGALRAGQVPMEAVEALIACLRRETERLLPGTGHAFDLIYLPRLRRAAEEAREER